MNARQPNRRKRALRHRADVRTLAFAATFFGTIALQWWLAPARLALALVLLPVTMVMAFSGAVSTHNVIHTPMFSRPWMNDCWRLVQTLWYGQPVSLFVPVHNHSHHKYAQTRRDLTRTTKADHDWQLANLWSATRWASAAARDCDAYFDAQAKAGRRIVTLFRRELATLVVTYVVLLALSWWRLLLFVVMPQMFGQFCIKAINYMQHDGCDYDFDGYDHSRNFTGWWMNFLFLNNGYHTVHHLRPGLHWSVLPEAHERLVKPHMDPRLDEPSFWAWFWPAMVWPGRRQRFDGAPYQWPPEGEGPDLAWDTRVAGNYDPPIELEDLGVAER